MQQMHQAVPQWQISQQPGHVCCVCRAARDIRDGVWEQGFNMGVAAIRPNATEYNRLLELLRSDVIKYGGWLNVLDVFSCISAVSGSSLHCSTLAWNPWKQQLVYA